jgi:hypothetical protein
MWMKTAGRDQIMRKIGKLSEEMLKDLAEFLGQVDKRKSKDRG